MNRIFTIPNLLSLIRILLIPVFVTLFFQDETVWAAVILIVSGLTDTLDGYIARHFHMITNLGKVLDPIADKLTQAVVAFCLCVRIPAVIPLFILLVLKEGIMFFAGIYGFFTRRNTLAILISIELILNATDINFAVFNRFLFPDGMEGYFFALFSIAISAAETAVAIAIMINIYRNIRSIQVNKLDELKW